MIFFIFVIKSNEENNCVFKCQCEKALEVYDNVDEGHEQMYLK